MKSLSFDGLDELYDETRDCDPACFNAALDYIENRFPPQTFRRLLEPGIGTGRIALPLARKGYQVTGIDISADMLRRLAQGSLPVPLSYQRADVIALPFAAGAFDIALAVHLFYFIRDWQRAAAELLRVLGGQKPILLMHTGTGAEVPFVNERYKALCAEQGCPIPAIGVKSTREVVAHFQQLGCQVEWIRDRWQWVSHIRLDKALRHLATRAYSFTTFASAEIHGKTVARLESELRAEYGTLQTEVEVPNQVYLVIVDRWAAISSGDSPRSRSAGYAHTNSTGRR